MIEIHLFEQLVAFASCGTLSAAAEQLHISQPALSRSMQRLEDELGVKLFDRQKSRLTLNENGALTVQYARSLLMQEESMIEQIREYDRKKRTISVGSCTPVLIPDFVSLLSSLYEGMTISTEVTGDPHLAEQLRENKYQLAILHEKPDENIFYSLPVESEHLYVSLPPVHPLADADGLYLKDLDGQTFLLYSQIGFWDGLCRRKMPSSRFLLQQEMDVLGENLKKRDLCPCSVISADCLPESAPLSCVQKKSRRKTFPLPSPGVISVVIQHIICRNAIPSAYSWIFILCSIFANAGSS